MEYHSKLLVVSVTESYYKILRGTGSMCEANPFITQACERAYTDFCFKECTHRKRGCANHPYPESDTCNKTNKEKEE